MAVDLNLYVPNAFTPDNDDLNEVFQPKGVGIAKYQLDIFDRWGEHLFNSVDFDTGWDGKYTGKLCKTDAYIWKITVTDAAGKIGLYQGHVNLLTTP